MTNFDPRSFFRRPEQRCIKCLMNKNFREFKRTGYLNKKISLTCKLCEEKTCERS